MPLTKKGKKIMANMKDQYGEEKGEDVFYASRNKGIITGVDPESKKKGPPKMSTQEKYNRMRKNRGAKPW